MPSGLHEVFLAINQNLLIFGGTGFQPVLAQAKACGYILIFHDHAFG
jgi:hypothetical protein